MSSVKSRPVEKETDEIDLGRLVGELIDHRKLILSVTAFLRLSHFYMHYLRLLSIRPMRSYR